MMPPVRPPGQPLSCAVCEATMLWPQPAPDGLAVCQAAPCRSVMNQRARMSPQAFRFYLDYHVNSLRSQKAARAEKAQREAAENEQHWADLRAHAGATRGPVVPLVLPSGRRGEARLTQRRRRAYRAHLYRMLREARDGGAPAQPAPLPAAPLPAAPLPAAPLPDIPQTPAGAADALAPLRERLCAVCAGACCTAGGDVAYLTAATMRRVMADQPSLTPRRLVAAYVGRLAEATLAGSCINHTRDGCSLPRELRSDTCNRYLCEAQKELGAQAGDGSAPVLALVIVRRQGQWTKSHPGLPNDVIGSACVSAAGVQPLVPLPLPSSLSA